MPCLRRSVSSSCATVPGILNIQMSYSLKVLHRRPHHDRSNVGNVSTGKMDPYVVPQDLSFFGIYVSFRFTVSKSDPPRFATVLTTPSTSTLDKSAPSDSYPELKCCYSNTALETQSE